MFGKNTAREFMRLADRAVGRCEGIAGGPVTLGSLFARDPWKPHFRFSRLAKQGEQHGLSPRESAPGG